LILLNTSDIFKMLFIRFLLVLVVGIMPIFCFAQYAEYDRMLWNGKVYGFYSSVIYSRADIQELRNKLNSKRDKDGKLLYCWRADLELIDDMLYLNNMVYCGKNSDVKADLEEIFGDEYHSGRVEASWFSDSLIINDGKNLGIWLELENLYLHERNIILSFKNGRLIKQRIGDNSKSHQSPYEFKEELLRQFIYSNINWKVIPPIEGEKNLMIITCTSGSERKPKRIEFVA
jgi:hypothetical protein